MLKLGTEFYGRKYCYFAYISSQFECVYPLISLLPLFFLFAGMMGLY
jgi:hypothetical protein